MAKIDNTSYTNRTNKQKVTTTEVEPTTTTTQKVSLPSYQTIGADGQVHTDPVGLARENEYVANLRARNKVDENGKYNGTLGDLFGFDPQRYIQEQEAREKLERFKQKEAGWKNALGVISDIVSAGVGGNVWERQPDGVAAKAEQKALQYEDNARKMAAAIPQAIAAREAAANEALNKHYQSILQEATITNKQGGGKVVTEKGGGFTENKSGTKSGSGVGYGSGQQPKVFNFKVIDGNGNTSVKQFDMPRKDYDALGNLILADMSKYISRRDNPNATEEEKQEANRVLDFWKNANYLSQDENGNVKPNIDVIMQNGEIAGLPMETRIKIQDFMNDYDKRNGGKGGYRMYTDEENAAYNQKNAQIPNEGNDRSSGGGNSKKDPRAAR